MNCQITTLNIILWPWRPCPKLCRYKTMERLNIKFILNKREKAIESFFLIKKSRIKWYELWIYPIDSSSSMFNCELERRELQNPSVIEACDWFTCEWIWHDIFSFCFLNMLVLSAAMQIWEQEIENKHGVEFCHYTHKSWKWHVLTLSTLCRPCLQLQRETALYYIFFQCYIILLNFALLKFSVLHISKANLNNFYFYK